MKLVSTLTPSRTVPTTALRELLSAASVFAARQSAALGELLDMPHPSSAAQVSAILGRLAAIRAGLLAADSGAAVDLWYEAVALSGELRAAMIDTFQVAPETAQEVLLARINRLAGREQSAFAGVRDLFLGDDLVVAAAGDFKRGKSTVLNALLGMHILPTRVAPATAVPCFIRAGACPAARVFYDDGRPPQSVPLADLERYVCIALPGEEEALAFQSGVARLEIEVPWSLPGGVTLVDLPGLNEDAGRSEMAAQALAHADAVLVVLSAVQLLAEDELMFLADLWRQGHRAFLFAINFRDRLDDGDLDLVRERAAHLLAPYGGELDRAAFLVSARQALAARLAGEEPPAESGMPALEVQLRARLTGERPALWRLSRLRQALDALEEAEWEAGRAALEQQELRRQIGAQLADLEQQRVATEHAQAAREAEVERAVGVALQQLAEHEQRYDGAWEALEAALREHCQREPLPWVWQEARAWLRDELVRAIRVVNPDVSPRPEGYLRIRVAPGLRLGRDALFAFYRDEAAREWERFTGAARQSQRWDLEMRLAAAERAREQAGPEHAEVLTALGEQRALLRDKLAATEVVLDDVLSRALAVATAVQAALQGPEFSPGYGESSGEG